LSRGPWKKKSGGGAVTKPLPKTPLQSEPGKTPLEKTTPQKTPVKSTSGVEIIPGVILEEQARQEAEKNAPPKVEDGEVIDLTDDELKELLGLLFQEGGNVALKFLKRQLIEDKEAATFGKLSLPYWRAKLKEKVNLGLTGPIIYALLVCVSKPLTPEGEKAKQEAALKKKAAADFAALRALGETHPENKV